LGQGGEEVALDEPGQIFNATFLIATPLGYSIYFQKDSGF
jgi:hypothetical protein